MWVAPVPNLNICSLLKPTQMKLQFEDICVSFISPSMSLSMGISLVFPNVGAKNKVTHLKYCQYQWRDFEYSKELNAANKYRKFT